MTTTPPTTDAPADATEAPLDGEVVAEGSTELVRHAEAQLATPVEHQRPDYLLAVELGRQMARSGYFTDAREEAQAAVKMIIGMDLGISPTASMTAIHIVKGKPMIGYQILAAKIIDHPHYGYRQLVHTDERCEVLFTDRRLDSPEERAVAEGDDPESLGEVVRYANEVGRVEWSIERAKSIGLVKADSGWANYARNMLFARCLSDGVKWYMPDLLTGAAVYVDDEIPEERRSLEAPSARPAPLGTPEAEAQRSRARTAYDALKDLNPTLMPPGIFGKLMRDSGHSLSDLTTAAEQVEYLLATERSIAEAWAKLRDELGDDEGKLAEIKGTFDRQRSQADRLKYLEGVVEAHTPDDEGDQDEVGG